MARLVGAIHNPLTVWMARIKRAMTEGKEDYLNTTFTISYDRAPPG
jgi:hypothetical protein